MWVAAVRAHVILIVAVIIVVIRCFPFSFAASLTLEVVVHPLPQRHVLTQLSKTATVSVSVGLLGRSAAVLLAPCPPADTSCAPEHEPRALAAEQERGSAVLLGGAAELAGQPQPRQRCLAAVGFELKPPRPGAPVHSGA